MDSIARLRHFELLDPHGRPVFLERALDSKPTLLCFVRHFGCIFCFEHATELLAHRERISNHGAQIVFIGNGNPAHALEFMGELRLTEGVYTDPARKLYRAFAMHHGLRRTLNLQTRKNARRASFNGFRQTGIKGDPWQQGGNVVLDSSGNLVSVQRAEVAGEQLDTRAAIDLLLSLASGRPAATEDRNPVR